MCNFRTNLTQRFICAHIGLAVVVHSSKGHHRELIHRFWIHEHKRNFWFTSHVVQALDNLGANYIKDSVHELLDLTTCFMDPEGFQQLNHKQILDFKVEPLPSYSCQDMH